MGKGCSGSIFIRTLIIIKAERPLSQEKGAKGNMRRKKSFSNSNSRTQGIE